MLSTTDTGGVSLSKYVLEVVENFVLEAKIVGVTSDGGSNLWFCREVLDSKYRNDSVFQHPSPSSKWSALHIYWQGLARNECSRSNQMMVRLTPN